MASLEIFSCFYRAACIVEKKKDPSKGRLLCNYLVNHYGRLNSAWFPHEWQQLLAVAFVPITDVSDLIFPYTSNGGLSLPSAKSLRVLDHSMVPTKKSDRIRSRKGVDHRGRENYRSKASIYALLADETANAMDFNGAS